MNNDEAVIESIVRTMFESICWDESKDADWDRFASFFWEHAILAPSARPASPSTVEAFVARMRGLRRDGVLRTFDEKILGAEVKVFGSVATARVAYSAEINGAPDGRGLNAFLFIKQNDAWLVAALAWDSESQQSPLPTDLLTAGPA